MSILIVDDDADMRGLLALILSESGLGHPLQASSGPEAFALLGLDDPSATAGDLDLILLDVMMKEMDGIEVCARIKADPRFTDIPIIMVSSIGDTDALQMAFVAGASDYIVKPVQPVELLARTRSALRLKQELDRRKVREQALSAVTGQLHEVETELEHYDVLDDGTALASQAALYDRIRRYIDTTPAATVGVLLIGIDAYANYTTYYSADATAAMLRRVAGALRQVPAHLGDMLARYNASTFAVFLPMTTETRTRALADAIRAAVAAIEIPHAYSEISQTISVSVGAATRVMHPGESHEIFDAAEAALRRARSAGENRVVVSV